MGFHPFCSCFSLQTRKRINILSARVATALSTVPLSLPHLAVWRRGPSAWVCWRQNTCISWAAGLSGFMFFVRNRCIFTRGFVCHANLSGWHVPRCQVLFTCFQLPVTWKPLSALAEKRDIGRLALGHSHETNLKSLEINRSPKLSNVMLPKRISLPSPKFAPDPFEAQQWAALTVKSVA